MKLVFASGNRGKIREALEILGEGFELLTPAEAGILEDIPETGQTLRENSLQKARYLYERTGMDCFADDTGLEVDCLGGAPGIHTARYAGEAKDPAANIDKLLREMEKAGGSRTARSQCRTGRVRPRDRGLCERHVCALPQRAGFGVFRARGV